MIARNTQSFHSATASLGSDSQIPPKGWENSQQKEDLMVKIRDTIWCDGCGVEIVWTPILKDNLHYCCADCQDGFGCDCGEELEEEYRESGTSTGQVSIHTP